MHLTLEIPDSMAMSIFRADEDRERRALEMLVLEGYRNGALSRGQVGRILGFGYFETEEFLHRNGAELHYNIEDFEKDSETFNNVLARQKAEDSTTAAG